MAVAGSYLPPASLGFSSSLWRVPGTKARKGGKEQGLALQHGCPGLLAIPGSDLLLPQSSVMEISHASFQDLLPYNMARLLLHQQTGRQGGTQCDF